jgi:DsbC/DsbD-like thiol-disulfide interchange protein
VNIRPLVCALALLMAGSGAAPVNGAAGAISKSTRHLAFTAMLAPDIVTPGTKMSLAVDVRPKKGMHVYAPGTMYRPVAIAIEPNPALKVENVIYPPPVSYLFKPLNERVLVYERPFRLTLDLTLVRTPAQLAALTAESRLTIKGQLTYQACDDKVCFLPASVPFEWSVRIAR